MRFESLVLARVAMAESPDGLLNVLGAGITKVTPNRLPWQERQFAVVCRLFADDDADLETVAHHVRVEITDPNDAVIAELHFVLQPEVLREAFERNVEGELRMINLLGQVNDMPITMHGLHHVRVRLDGEEVLAYPLPVASPPD